MKSIIYINELVGSRLFGINTDQSDYDYFKISNLSQKQINKNDKVHETVWDIENGLNLLLSIYNYFHFELETGFGKKEINNSFVEYVENNKEKFKYNNIGNSFKSFINYENLFKKNIYGKDLYNLYPKLNMYFILYKHIFINYPKTLVLEEYIHPQEEIRQFLLAIRKHEISYQEVLNFELPLRREMDKVKSFYADRFNEEYAAREKEKMKLIIQNLEKENF